MKTSIVQSNKASPEVFIALVLIATQTINSNDGVGTNENKPTQNNKAFVHVFIAIDATLNPLLEASVTLTLRIIEDNFQITSVHK